MKKQFSGLFVALITAWLCWPLAAPAADSTSFNPVPVFVEAESSGGVPVGTIVSWPVATNPADWHKWLECDGQTIDPLVYSELASLVGPVVPDLRGLFLRGHGTQAHSQLNGSIVGVTSSLHQSGALGTVQGDAIRQLEGSFLVDDNFSGRGAEIENGFFRHTYRLGHVGGFNVGADNFASWILAFQSSRVSPTANEIRPANMAVRYLIKALK
jgi:hypothetical protein